MKYPFVSVVIPAYNEEKFIGRTLASLQEQDYKGKFEIIVVDNASTDNTAAVAKSFGATVIYQPIKGLAVTRQKGFESAKGELIASTDADDVLPPNWISRFVAELIAHPEYVAIGGWFKLMYGPIMPRLYIYYLSAPILRMYNWFTRKSILQDQNYMVRKAAFDEVGGYKGLHSMNEDLMLAQRLSTIGIVKMHYGMDWAVQTSPRRWNKGFFRGGIHYFVNATCYALFRKLPIKDFSDIREENHAAFGPSQLLSFGIGCLLFTGIFFATPIPAVQAKFDPIAEQAKKTVAKVENGVAIVKNPQTVIEPIKQKTLNKLP